MGSITYQVAVDEYGTEWRLDGKLHREDGPAIERVIGTKLWYLNDQLHRENGPAIEWANGSKFWLVCDQYHREDGPAIELADGYKAWYLNGVKMTKKRHQSQTRRAVELTIKIEQSLDKRVEIIK
jgi:hypothetical protein